MHAGTVASEKKGRPSRGSRLRRVRMGLSYLGFGFLLAGLLTLYGWRYGFTPLPRVLDSHPFVPVRGPSWSEAGPDSCWHWFRETGRATEADAGEEQEFLSEVEAWTRRGWPASAVSAEQGPRPAGSGSRSAVVPAGGAGVSGRWLQSRPVIEHNFECALAARETSRPETVERYDLMGAVLLSHYPLWRASEHERQGRTLVACRELIRAWQLQARFVPAMEFADLFDERQGEQVNEMLGRPWRRLALAGPALPLAETRGLLAELAAVTNALPPIDVVYARLATPRFLGSSAQSRPDWQGVRRSFEQAGGRLRQEAAGLVRWLASIFLGERSERRREFWGVGSLTKPVAGLLRAVQQAVARPEDIRHVEQAFLSHQLASLRAAPSRNGTALDLRAAWLRSGAFARLLDRPAVWQSVLDYPDPVLPWAGLNWWRVYLESCRLTLALRAYREIHGRWPDRLADLAPEILPAVPIDPFSGETFRYECEGERWRFWSLGLEGRDPQPHEPDRPPQRLYRSAEGAVSAE